MQNKHRNPRNIFSRDNKKDIVRCKQGVVLDVVAKLLSSSKPSGHRGVHWGGLYRSGLRPPGGIRDRGNFSIHPRFRRWFDNLLRSGPTLFRFWRGVFLNLLLRRRVNDAAIDDVGDLG